MPIQGASGETAIQYGGNTYINDNPTRTAYNNNPSWNTVKRPTTPTPRHPNPTPTPTYHPAPAPKPAPAPVVHWNPAPPPPPPVAVQPYSPPVPLGKYASIYSPTDTSATVGKPQAPTAFDQKWNPTYTGSVPLGKLYNLYNPVPDPSIDAKTAYDKKYLSGQYAQKNNANNYASNPTGLANSLTGNTGWGNVIEGLKNLFTPQVVNDKPSAASNPVLTAQKAVSNNDPWAAIENLGKGIAAPIVGLAGMFGANNNDQKKAPQDSNARDITNHTPTPASQLSPYPNYGHGGIDMTSLIGQAPSANNPYGLNPSSSPSSQASSGGSAKTGGQFIDPKNVDPNVTIMTTDKDGNQVKATPYDIAYNENLYKQYLAQTYNGSGAERTIIPHGNGQAIINAMPSTPDSSSQNTGSSGANGNYIGGGTAPLDMSGYGGSGGSLLDSLMGGGGIGMGGTGGVPTDGSGQPSFLDYGLNADEQNALMEYAKGQALLQNNVQRNSLDLQKNQQEDAYNSQVKTLNNDLTNAQQQLENQSFQDYLKSRQDIADRGLGSSGLANDADTRLMLNRDQQLGQLQRQNDASLSSALATKNTNEANIAAQRSQVNDDVTANNLFQQLYSQRLTSKQQANQLAEDWAKWNQTSGNYAYRYGISAQNAQLNAATKLQVAQMANSMKLQTTDMNNNTKINIAQGNLQAKLQQISNQAWNWSQSQNIDLAKQLGTGAMQILKQIPNASSPQEAQGLLSQYNSMMDEFANQLGQAQSGTQQSSGFNYSSGGGGAVPSLKGSNTAQQMYNFFVGKGLSPAAAAGIMGNLQQENGLSTADNSGGMGIAQWIGGRRTAEINYAKSIGVSPTSLEAQLGYLWNELSSGGEGINPAQLNAAGSPQAAAVLFSNKFERPAAWAANNNGRANYAAQFYNMLNR